MNLTPSTTSLVSPEPPRLLAPTWSSSAQPIPGAPWAQLEDQVVSPGSGPPAQPGPTPRFPSNTGGPPPTPVHPGFCPRPLQPEPSWSQRPRLAQGRVAGQGRSRAFVEFPGASFRGWLSMRIPTPLLPAAVTLSLGHLLHQAQTQGEVQSPLCPGEKQRMCLCPTCRHSGLHSPMLTLSPPLDGPSEPPSVIWRWPEGGPLPAIPIPGLMLPSHHLPVSPPGLVLQPNTSSQARSSALRMDFSRERPAGERCEGGVAFGRVWELSPGLRIQGLWLLLFLWSACVVKGKVTACGPAPCIQSSLLLAVGL